jgi:metal-dependent amidase/aminoacylase/carboxypeptidase family protein
MIKAGVFKDVDIAMMAHPSPFNLAAVHSLAIEQFVLIFLFFSCKN